MNELGPSTRLFFDASCLIAAAASPNGGSGFLWSLCERGLLCAIVSHAVLMEAETNLTRKFPAEALIRHHMQRQAAAPVIAAIPRLDVTPRRFPGVNVKDEHVIAAANAGDAQFVLTLDRPLEREINRAQRNVQAVSPGEFIHAYLPHHASFATLRDQAR